MIGACLSFQIGELLATLLDKSPQLLIGLINDEVSCLRSLSTSTSSARACWALVGHLSGTSHLIFFRGGQQSEQAARLEAMDLACVDGDAASARAPARTRRHLLRPTDLWVPARSCIGSPGVAKTRRQGRFCANLPSATSLRPGHVCQAWHVLWLAPSLRPISQTQFPSQQAPHPPWVPSAQRPTSKIVAALRTISRGRSSLWCVPTSARFASTAVPV